MTSSPLEDEVWFAERVAFEQLSENKVLVEVGTTRWHPAIAPLRAKLRAEVKEMAIVKRDAERAKKNPQVVRQPGWNGGGWQLFLDRGQILNHTHKAAPMRVTQGTYERALAILNTLCSAAGRRAFAVQMNEERGRIQLKGHDATIDVRIAERLEPKTRKEKTSWDDAPRIIKFYEPTGLLRVCFGASYSEAEVADDRKQPLEAKLNEVFVRMFRDVVRVRQKDREHEARLRELEAEYALCRAAAAREQEEAARKEQERRRRHELIVEAKRWHTAALVREYVSHIASKQLDGYEELQEWKQWALDVADALDPTPVRLERLKERLAREIDS